MTDYSSALDNSARKAQKSKNTNGDPIKLSSKILAVVEDPEGSDESPALFVAEAAGNVKRVSVQVCTKSMLSIQTFKSWSIDYPNWKRVGSNTYI